MGLATADSDVHPAATEHIQHGHLLGQHYQVVQREDDDGGAYPYAAGSSGEVGAQHQGRRGKAVTSEVVLRQPDGLEAQLLGVLHLLQDLLVGLLRALGLGPLDVGEHRVLHRRPSSGCRFEEAGIGETSNGPSSKMLLGPKMLLGRRVS